MITLRLLGLYFRRLIFIDEGKIPNIICQLILFSKHYNEHIQISKSFKSKRTLNIIFPLGQHCFAIKEVTRDIANIYVRTVIIFKQICFWMHRWKIYQKLCVSFLTIIFNNIVIKLADIYDRITTSGSLLQKINIS